MSKENNPLLYGEQIKKKLKSDGRTNRWLLRTLETKNTDVSISNKLNGITPFTSEELKKISKLLNIKFV